MLRDLGVVVDRKLHIREVVHGGRRVEVHDVAADAILCDFTPSEALVELALGLFPLGEHFVVHWARGQVRDAR